MLSVASSDWRTIWPHPASVHWKSLSQKPDGLTVFVFILDSSNRPALLKSRCDKSFGAEFQIHFPTITSIAHRGSFDQLAIPFYLNNFLQAKFSGCRKMLLETSPY
jgi:hypothetical protein